jgi:hypothetical protein
MSCFVVAAAYGDFVAELVMHNYDTATQKAYGTVITSNGYARAIVNAYTVAINTGSGVDLTVQGVLEDDADQITVSGIEIWRGGH